MIRYKVKQGTPEWDALRAANDTASEASAMMGVSRHTSRTELLNAKATGSVAEFSDWKRKFLLERGHSVEPAARALAEKLIGKELFPATIGSDEYDNMLASCDGLTMDGKCGAEIKLWNKDKAAQVMNGEVPEEDYWQVVQQLVATRADRWLYMVSDGTEENTVSCMVTLNERDEKRLVAGWKLFNEDRAKHTPTENTPALIGAVVESLPILSYDFDPKALTVTSNIDKYRAASAIVLAKADTPLVTDQDFADRKTLCKMFRDAQENLALKADEAIGKIENLATFSKSLRDLSEMFRAAAIDGEKKVESEEKKRKEAIRQGAVTAYQSHVAAINLRLSERGVTLPNGESVAIKRIADAAKNKRTLDSMQNAVDTELANLKLDVDEVAAKIEGNLAILREIDTGYEFLFRDRQELVMRDPETLTLLAEKRVSDHKAEEERKLEAQREQIRQEEAARVEREHREEQERIAREEQAERERIAASQVESTQAVAQAAIESESEPAPAAEAAPIATESVQEYQQRDVAVTTADPAFHKPVARTPIGAAVASRMVRGVNTDPAPQIAVDMGKGDVGVSQIYIDTAEYTKLVEDCARYKVALEQIADSNDASEARVVAALALGI